MTRPDYRTSHSKDWYDTLYEIANAADHQRQFELSKAAAQELLREFISKKWSEINGKD